MKPGYCNRCPKRTICTDADECPRMRAELYRIEYGRKKHRTEVIYEWQLKASQLIAWNTGNYNRLARELETEALIDKMIDDKFPPDQKQKKRRAEHAAKD